MFPNGFFLGFFIWFCFGWWWWGGGWLVAVVFLLCLLSCSSSFSFPFFGHWRDRESRRREVVWQGWKMREKKRLTRIESYSNCVYCIYTWCYRPTNVGSFWVKMCKTYCFFYFAHTDAIGLSQCLINYSIDKILLTQFITSTQTSDKF